MGSYALSANTLGRGNTATGFQSLGRNTTGIYNTANGYQALHENTTGSGTQPRVAVRSMATPPAAITPQPVRERCRV